MPTATATRPPYRPPTPNPAHADPHLALAEAAAPSPTPLRLLRLEGAALLGVALVAYGQLGGSWASFALLFLVPDLSLAGYLAGPRVGAAVYNVGHALLGPVALAALAVGFAHPALLLAALIWAAHIGFDRMLGYGLKYTTGFHHTHLSPAAPWASVARG